MFLNEKIYFYYNFFFNNFQVSASIKENIIKKFKILKMYHLFLNKILMVKLKMEIV